MHDIIKCAMDICATLSASVATAWRDFVRLCDEAIRKHEARYPVAEECSECAREVIEREELLEDEYFKNEKTNNDKNRCLSADESQALSNERQSVTNRNLAGISRTVIEGNKLVQESSVDKEACEANTMSASKAMLSTTVMYKNTFELFQQ